MKPAPETCAGSVPRKRALKPAAGTYHCKPLAWNWNAGKTGYMKTPAGNPDRNLHLEEPAPLISSSRKPASGNTETQKPQNP